MHRFTKRPKGSAFAQLGTSSIPRISRITGQVCTATNLSGFRVHQAQRSFDAGVLLTLRVEFVGAGQSPVMFLYQPVDSIDRRVSSSGGCLALDSDSRSYVLVWGPDDQRIRQIGPNPRRNGGYRSSRVTWGLGVIAKPVEDRAAHLARRPKIARSTAVAIAL